jgi:hypoxanthine phosphoribosyltransferase
LLDFYGVVWEYEPVEFTLEWDSDGNPVQGFRPDFYLPAYDLFIEITTLNQRLVTKKNRKVRRLRELHPEVQVKILYQRDYLNLLVKFGLEDPAALAAAADDDGVTDGDSGLDGAA